MQPELVFKQAFEGLFLDALRERRTPAFDARLRLLGLDLERPLLPAYPRATWQHALRSGCNYQQVRLTDAGPGEVLLWVNEPDLPPAFGVGLLGAVLALGGARDVDVREHARDAGGRTYRVRWRP